MMFIIFINIQFTNKEQRTVDWHTHTFKEKYILGKSLTKRV